jgi:phosphoglucosamine mutase
MFGTSGIRGVYGRDITEELSARVSSVFAGSRLAVGRDIRESGGSLLEAACLGAFAAGAEVIDLGIVPTPTVALATRKHGCRGLMLTASHNPPEYNGLKLIEGGKEIGKGLEKEITRRYKESRPVGRAEGVRVHDEGIIGDHKGMIASLVDGAAIAKRAPRVIVDCNGAASVITPCLLSDLGCRVVSLNSSVHCFNRPSEPSEANLPYLPGLIRSWGADMAIVHDGDGDRCMVFDEKGRMLPLDAQLAIMMEHELSDGGTAVSTVEASLTIREVARKAGAEIEITPVGSTYVGDALEEGGAVFGGEPCGEYIYRDGVHVPDAVLAAAKFAEIFSRRGSFSSLRDLYPQHPMARERFQAEDKLGAMERIRERISIEGSLREDDGLRVDEEDGWFLIRASGTEPIIRLTMEYREKGKLEKRKKELSALIRSLTPHRASRQRP